MTEYINTYNELCEKVKRWSAAYYEQDAPVVTDEEYDRAMHEIRDLEAAHPELVTSDSPTQVVGGKRVIGIPVEHRVPMLSLLDVFSDAEVRDFAASVAKEDDMRTQKKEKNRNTVLREQHKKQSCSVHILYGVIGMDVCLDHVYDGRRNNK